MQHDNGYSRSAFRIGIAVVAVGGISCFRFPVRRTPDAPRPLPEAALLVPGRHARKLPPLKKLSKASWACRPISLSNLRSPTRTRWSPTGRRSPPRLRSMADAFWPARGGATELIEGGPEPKRDRHPWVRRDRGVQALV